VFGDSQDNLFILRDWICVEPDIGGPGSISDPAGALGKYRYLLFDIVATEMEDDWGNTFYSEVDVVAKKKQ